MHGINVPEVLNVQVNENKKIYFFRIFFEAVKNKLSRKKI